MNKGRRIGALVVTSAAAIGMASLVAPTAAEAAPRGPQPVSSGIRAVQAHTDTWVGIRWATDRRICDVEVRVYGRNVDVDYPGWRRSTSFSRTDSLRAGRSDVTAFRVNPEFRRSGIARLNATIQYDNCGRNARTMRRSFDLYMPVIVRHNGPGNGNGNGNGHGGPGNGHGGPGNGNGQGGPGNGHGGPGNGNGQGGPGNGHGGPGNGHGPQGQGQQGGTTPQR